MNDSLIERVPAELLVLNQVGDTYVVVFGLEDDGRATVAFTAATVPELVANLVLLRHALGRDVW